MKGKKHAVLAFALICALLTGCVRVVNEIQPGGGTMDLKSDSDTEATEDYGAAATERSDEADSADTEDTEDVEEEDDVEASVRLVLSEEGYDEVKHIASGKRFAVRDGASWGVVDENGNEIFATEYDYIETDGNGLYSLTVKDGSYFDARLMYYDEGAGTEDEVFTNEQYPEMDFTALYRPYITMTSRGSDPLDVMYVEVERIDGFDFNFYRWSKLNSDMVYNAGWDANKWEGTSGFMQFMTDDGGSFVSSTDWAPEGAGYSNVIGIDGYTQIVFSEIERARTIRMMPYAADTRGYYGAYIVEIASGDETPAFGNLNNIDFSAAGLTAFPDGTAELIPDVSGGTPRAGKNGRAVIADADGNEAIFDMQTGEAETEFAYQSILLSDDARFPSVATEDKQYVYITADGEKRDTGEAAYSAASRYDEDAGYALVIDEEGRLFAIDQNGTRVSEREEGFDDGETAYLSGDESHAFSVKQDGKYHICFLEEM